jgi:copper(I)-binding protein
MKNNLRFLKRYLLIIGVLANTLLILGSIVLIFKLKAFELPLPIVSAKIATKLAIKQPELFKIVSPILKALAYFKVENRYFRKINVATWLGKGANINDMYRTTVTDINVGNSAELLSALKKVPAGGTIVLKPGDYHLKYSKVKLGYNGNQKSPIKVTAEKLGSVKLYMQGEGFLVNKAYWQFSNLHIIGLCSRHSTCEHAFHVVGKAKNIVIRNNILQDFNAMIKVNGVANHYPDNGRVLKNTIFNTSARKTANPVTPVDLMHANYWKVADNFIFDIQKSSGDKISYAAFFKGGSKQGIFERNLVMCAANLPDDYTSLGLSLGGGGSLKHHRRNQNSAEHIGGVIRNNIIMHCANDVGIYINRSRESLIEHNILYNTLGIDIRYSESDATIANNVISGRIKVRNNAKVVLGNNIIVNREFLTGKDRLLEYFVAPDIGDFTWKQGANSNLRNILTTPAALDFCGSIPVTSYIGAFSDPDFCFGKLNIYNYENSKPTE